MPYAYSHVDLGRRIIERLPEGARAAIEKNPGAFTLGCHGPDLYFYDVHFDDPAPRPGKNMGSMMHSSHTGECFQAMLPAASGNECAEAFAMGHICHYVLDYITHPYICYVATSSEHTRFEAAMETALIEHAGNTLMERPVREVLEARPDERAVIDALLARVCFAVYGADDLAGRYEICYKKMLDFEDATYDPTGEIKKSWEEYRQGRGAEPRFPEKFLFYPHGEPGVDYLNLAHKPWQNPWGDGEVYTESLLDLIKRAEDEASEMCALAWQAMAKGEASYMQKALARIGAKSFSTGYNWDDKREHKGCLSVLSGKTVYADE